MFDEALVGLDASGFGAFSPHAAALFAPDSHAGDAATFDFHSLPLSAPRSEASGGAMTVPHEATAKAKLSKTDEQIFQVAKDLYLDDVDSGTADEELNAIAERVSNYEGRQVPISYLESGVIKALADNNDLTDMAALIGDTQFGSERPTFMKEILTKAEKPAADGVVDAAVLSAVISQELAYESMTQAAARSEIAKAAKTAGAKIDAWLFSALDGIGGYNGIVKGREPYVETTYFAIADVMGPRVNSGVVAKLVAADISAGKMNDKAALAYVKKYAEFAMLNAGYKGKDAFLADKFEQADGVNDNDRAGLMLVQMVDDLKGAEASALEKAIVKTEADTYLIGLGLDGAMAGGRTVAANLLKAENVLMQTAMPKMQAASDNNDANPLMLTTAQKLIFNEFNQYVSGTKAVGAAITYTIGDSSLGSLSIGAVSSSNLQSLGSMNVLIKLGDKLLTNSDEFPDNPLGAVGSIAAVAQVVLENYGIGNLLGPFAGPVEGVVNLVADTSNAINKELNDVATAVVAPTVIVGSTLIFHAADNLANFGEDLFTGNFSEAVDALKSLGTQLGQDLEAAGEALASALETAANDIISAVGTLEKDVASLVEMIPGLSTFDEVVGPAFGSIGDWFSSL